jgi:hypothetical protein
MTHRRHRLVRILAALALVAMLAVAGRADAGKPPSSEPAQYDISMSDLAAGAMGVTSDCPDGQPTTVLAREEHTPGFLHAGGSDLDLNLHTDVQWSREYPVPTSGVFQGCFGVTPSLNGNLFIDFERDWRGSVVHIIWHFDYYIASGVREQFTLQSEHIPFPEWTGQDVSARVSGTFDLQYSLREGKRTIASYRSLTNGEGRPFDFLLTITKVS